MLDLLSDDMRRDPYPVYRQLAAESPVVHIAAADLWMLLDYESVKHALHDTTAFGSNVAPSRGVNFEWLMFCDPPRHGQLRAIIGRAFTARSIADLEPRIRDISRELLDGIVPRGEFDLATEYATPLAMQVIAEMVGLPASDWRRLATWSDAIIGLGSTILGSEESARDASAAFIRANDEMVTYVADMLAIRRTDPRDDLITRLAQAEVEGVRLSELEIVRFVQLLLAAGTETTTNLIANTILSLLAHPDVHERVRAQTALVPALIEEVLRHRSPVQVVFRVTKRAVTLHGTTIPPGKFVLVVLGAANRDATVYADPDRFDIAREANPHLAFGHGIHFCIGAPLSRLEARIAIPDLLARLPSLARATDDPWPPRKAFHVHGPTHLPLRFRS